jgi:hypothetical protein
MNSLTIPKGCTSDAGHTKRLASTSLKRLSVGLIFGLSLLVLSGYGLIPDLVRALYIFFLDSVALYLAFTMIETRPIVIKTPFVLASLFVSLVLMDLALRPVMQRPSRQQLRSASKVTPFLRYARVTP